MAVVCIPGMLVFGSMNTILLKYQMTLSAVGVEGTPKTFEKPWFLTLSMFLGMVLSLVVVAAMNCQARIRRGKKEMLLDESNLAEADASTDELPYVQKVCLVALPAVFDLAAIGLALTGLKYVPASVWQVLRGASIIFAEVISVAVLKTPACAHKWIGVFFCILGICLVGLASVLGAQDTDSGDASKSPVGLVILGMGLILLGQVVQAAQTVAEEYFMKKLSLPALEVIGYEGMWGIVVMAVLVLPLFALLPGDDAGCLENTSDTFEMLHSSSYLSMTFVVLVISCLLYNLCGIGITSALTAVHRLICEAMRTAVVWGFALVVHYCDPKASFGESLTMYSLIEVAGFLVLILGQMIYGSIIRIPGIEYPSDTDIIPYSSPL